MTTESPMLIDRPSLSDRFFRSRWPDALLGAFVGLAAFFSLGFDRVFPPHRVAWLLTFIDKIPYYDAASAYVSWNYFRHTPWQFPLGANPNYGMEYATSIFTVDSVAGLAILCKPFAPLMGKDWQYIGILLFSSFVLQGVFAALLASRIVGNAILKALIACFFVLSPLVLERAGDQYGLTAHWIVLWGLYLCLTNRVGGIRWVWLPVLMISVGIHLYFVPMILGLWFADALKAFWLKRSSFAQCTVEAFVMLATLVFTMWCIGYFMLNPKDASTPNFGMFALNLMGPFDSWGRSMFFIQQPSSPFHLGEGFSYLGFGIILLFAVAIFEVIRTGLPRRVWLPAWPLIVMMLGLTIFALSNKIALGNHVLELPNFWSKVGDSFRSSGRMFWPPYYALWLGVMYLAIRNLTTKKAIILLTLALAVQVIDCWPMYRDTRVRYTASYHWRSPLTDPFWDAAAKKYKEIVIVPSGAPVSAVPLAYLGSNNNMATNGAGLGRYPGPEIIDPARNKRLKEFADGLLDSKTLYIVPEDGRFVDYSHTISKTHGVGTINGYHVVAPFWFASADSPKNPLITPAAGSVGQ